MDDDTDGEAGEGLQQATERAPTTRRKKDARRGAALLVVGGLVVPLAVIGLQLASLRNDDRSSRPDVSDREAHLWPGATDVAPIPTTDPTELVTPSTSPAATGSPSASSSAAPTTASQPATTTTTTPPPAGLAPLLVDDFDGDPGWGGQRGRNDLGWATECEVFVSCTVSGGALVLTYDDDGWFGTYVNRNATDYTYLVLRIRGQRGGEEGDIRLTLGGRRSMLSDLTLVDGGTPRITTTYQDLRIPMAANGISKTDPGELELDFWHGGTSTIYIDEIGLA